MTTATDITALKARCTALEKRVTATETKDTALSTAATTLTARVAKLEAVKPVDYSVQITALQKEVDALTRIIISPTPDTFPPVGGVNAMSYCHGDGVTDDRAHIEAAIAAAAGTPVYFLNGTYLLSSQLTVPSGTTLVGQSMTGTHLKGKIYFGSTSSFTDLKLGNNSVGVNNSDGATSTEFLRCRFTGGGGSWPQQQVLGIGFGNDASDLTFTDCEVERCYGTDPTYSLGRNNVKLDIDNCTIDGVTFDGCTFGVSNGTATGCPRVNVECFSQANVAVGWQSPSFIDCIFEQSDAHQLDLACPTSGNGVASHALVQGCTFKGSFGTLNGWGYCIALEWPIDVTITGNHFQRSSDAIIDMDDNTATYPGRSWVFTDNVFDMDTDNGLDPGKAFTLRGHTNVITGNTFYRHDANLCVELAAASTSNEVKNNTFHINGTEAQAITDNGTTNDWAGHNTVVHP